MTTTYKIGCVGPDGDQYEREATLEEIAEIESNKQAAIAENSKYTVLYQIAKLESLITPRRIREALLTGDTTYISMIESQIAALRTKL